MKIHSMAEIWGLGATASEYWKFTGRLPGETGGATGDTGIEEHQNQEVKDEN